MLAAQTVKQNIWRPLWELPRRRELVPCARGLRVAQRWTIRLRRFGVLPVARRDGAGRSMPLDGY